MSDRHFYAGVSRRRLIQGAATMGLLAGFDSLLPAYARGQLDNTNAFHTVRNGADIYDLTVARTPLKIGGTVSEQPITINGTLPAPLVRLKQGREAILRVTNTLPEATSIHWHGLILPYQMDGVPGVSFPGIMPGETFEYRFPVEQHGTYWYHSHSGLQEQLGHYGPIIIDPAEPESVAYDREYVVVLSDWTFDSPEDVFRNLKVAEGYYNYNQRTVGDFFKDVETMGWDAAWSKAGMWGRMRMSPRDILDVTASEYTYLMNGSPSASNWTGLFRPGEKIRLRFINASAMTYFDVRIPGLPMTVISADGQPVQPVETDEFRIGHPQGNGGASTAHVSANRARYGRHGHGRDEHGRHGQGRRYEHGQRHGHGWQDGNDVRQQRQSPWPNDDEWRRLGNEQDELRQSNDE